jgi:hypothetical protein
MVKKRCVGVDGFDYGLKPDRPEVKAERGEDLKKDAPPACAEIEGLVTSLFLRWPNPRLVSVMVDGAVWRCRVKDRALFAPGMRIPVRMIEQGLYECQGTPRARGRWA